MQKSKILSKEKIADTIYIIKYEIPKDLEWKPGQYMGIQTGPLYRRCYSIWELKDGVVSFMIDTKPGGLASQFFEIAEVGNENLVLGPYGRFRPLPTTNHKVFISTGTGIVPFYPAIDEIRNSPEFKDTKITFVFGTRYFKDEVAYNYVERFIDDKFEYIQCVTRSDDEEVYKDKFPKAKQFSKRVTEVVPELDLDFANCEFYICGSPQMVDDMGGVLKSKSATKIMHEKYSA